MASEGSVEEVAESEMSEGKKEVSCLVGEIMSERRGDVRVDCNVPIFLGLVDDGADVVEVNELRVLVDRLDPASTRDPSLYGLLTEIKYKLDFIIKNMSSGGADPFEFPEARLESISGGGMRLTCSRMYEKLQRIGLRLYIPDHGEGFDLTGEVVWVEPLEDRGYRMGIKFVDIDSLTKERIIRYIFSWHRKMLRTRGEGT